VNVARLPTANKDHAMTKTAENVSIMYFHDGAKIADPARMNLAF
jgi:hypothetical protein